jgi:hypothetical protein
MCKFRVSHATTSRAHPISFYRLLLLGYRRWTQDLGKLNLGSLWPCSLINIFYNSGRNTSPPCKLPNSSLTSAPSTLPVSSQSQPPIIWRCTISLLGLHVPSIGYSYFSATYWPFMPTMGTCSGTEGAALFGCALLTSYLFLFIDFYIRTYKPVKAKA